MENNELGEWIDILGDWIAIQLADAYFEEREATAEEVVIEHGIPQMVALHNWLTSLLEEV